MTPCCVVNYIKVITPAGRSTPAGFLLRSPLGPQPSLGLGRSRSRRTIQGLLEKSLPPVYSYPVAVKSFTSAGAQQLALALSREPRQAHLQGLTPGAGAYILARFFQHIHRPVLLITPNVNFPEQIFKDLSFLSGRRGGPGYWPRVPGAHVPGPRGLTLPGIEL